MFWILNFICSYIVSMFFGVLFDGPKRLYFASGFVGACGWMVYTILYNGLGFHSIYASFFGSLTLGAISHVMARTKKEPVILFMIPGIIPLVPGGLAFDATKNLVLLEFGEAINTMLEVALVAGAIALGLLFADQLAKLYILSMNRRRKHAR
ncbi:threonine/serine exporter family protein [Staphylococcus auricularis]|uniref:Threonine/serine exporter family protein n=1 Tax=Staphylococcus auricularis TaxID=29379 RepID=A0AAW7MEH2_9STAP|nr:threonine/serine exporter family protein [Staphylococcus auricularis]MDC6327742.1 threonine/serine exporter family protein [Staphylococcus auricularis]MDN4533693.1 threonine/serine exporter family protein [Staphylococcus auricularis]